MAPVPARGPADAARLREALVLSGLLSVALVLFYVVLFPIKGIRVPAWSDAQTYIWWARRAGALGLSASGTGSRPGTVGMLATLSTLTHLPVEAVVEAIGPVLGASVGLAAAALSESVLGPHRGRFVLAAGLAGTFVSQLVPSFFATLAFAAMFVAGLAYFSEGLGEGRAVPFVGAGILFGAAGLAHPVFEALGAGLVLGGLVVLALHPVKRSAGDGMGSTPDGSRWPRWVFPVALGFLILALGLIVARAASGPPLDTSADAVFRRLGLKSLLRKTFRDTLSAYLPIFLPTTAVAALAFSVVPKGRWASTPVRQRLFGGVVVVWLAVTVLAIPLLFLGVRIPAQRLVALCLPLPLLIAAGMANSGAGWGGRRARAAVMMALIAGLAFLVPRYWLAWDAQRANSARAVADARTLGSVLARQPAGTPLVLIANDLREAPSFFQITRLASYLRDGVPPARVPDVHVFVGTPADFVAGRPTLIGSPARDRLASDYWDRLRAVLDRPTLAVAVSSLDPLVYEDVLGMRGHVSLAPGVVALPGYTGDPGVSAPTSAALASAGAGPLSPWLPVWLAPLLMMVLGVVGWPWVGGTLPEANPRIRAALAPAVGIAAISVAAIVIDALGLRLDGWGAVLAVLVALGAGLGTLARSGRKRRDTVPPSQLANVGSSVGSPPGRGDRGAPATRSE